MLFHFNWGYVAVEHPDEGLLTLRTAALQDCSLAIGIGAGGVAVAL
jgi:hypothetical protein